MKNYSNIKKKKQNKYKEKWKKIINTYIAVLNVKANALRLECKFKIFHIKTNI